MNNHYSLYLVAALLVGCEAPSIKTRPGATLTGGDLPPTKRGVLAETDQPPVPVKMQNPQYPFSLRKAGITGVVVVEFIVGIDGKVKDAHAISSPHEDLSKAAVEAMLKSEYRPAIKSGAPAEVKMRVPITFNL